MDIDGIVEKYATSAQEYARLHARSTGVTDTRRYTKKVHNTISAQATTRVMNSGCALMVTIGSDLEPDDCKFSTFFKCDCRSSKIVRD